MGNVAYYRVSTRRQGQSGLGLDAQKAVVAHYYGDLVAEFVEVESGKAADNRPELEAAVRLCLSDGHTLVVAKVDRLSRNTADTLAIYDRLSGGLRCADVPYDGNDPSMFKFILTIQAALAERERELISIRTKAALAAAKRRGQELGSPDNLPDDAAERGARAKRQAARAAYRKVAGYAKMMRQQGMSYDKIARRLNDDGHRTRTGKRFQATTVWRILERNGGIEPAPA